MRKFKALCQFSLHLLFSILFLFLAAGIAFSQDAIPDWTSINYAPFYLVEPTEISNPVLTANDVTDVTASFVADPFLFRENDKWYMFFEVFNTTRERGEIGFATSFDGLHWKYDQIVLFENWHLSYPLVFKYNGEYYLIPESSEQNEVRIYRANLFPYNWTHDATLVTGRDFVDPSVFYYNNTWWMFVSDTSNRNCYLFYSDNLTSGWTEHLMSPIVSNNKSKARPGGRSFALGNDQIIRISQKDDVIYGEQVRAFEVDILTKTDYSEHEVPQSPILKPSGLGWNKTGMHHFDPWWNENHWFCAVDGKSGAVWSIGLYTASSIVIEAEEMSYHSSGEQEGVYWVLFSEGIMSENVYFPYTGMYHFEITARGDLAFGIGPEMEVLIDDESKDTFFVNTETPETFVFDAEVSIGTHELAISFNNDLWYPAQGIDRNLYVDKIKILLSFPNEPPIADAGPDQTVEEGLTVTLDASNSTDPDDGIASYLWTQTTGPTVTLSDQNAVKPSFTSPDVEPDGTSLVFELTVTDSGGLKDTDTCIINVTWVNMPPTADAGPDQTVEEGLTVTLDGSNSSDPGGDTISYQWIQLGGIPVTLSSPTAQKPTFVTPIVSPAGMNLIFNLMVKDEGDLQDSDEVTVTVNDNGISGFPDDVLTTTCSTGKVIGMKVESGGDLVSIAAVDSAAIPDSPDKPDNLPYGLFDLVMKPDTLGGSVKVRFYLESKAGNIDKWFKYKNSIGTWEDCSAYASLNAARDQVTLTLVDGGDGDDGPADGWIVDPSGLSSSTSSSGGGGGGCFIVTVTDG